MRITRLAAGIAVFAALAGCAGVALAAVAAHKVQSPSLGSAAHMLMVHGAAGLALIAVARGDTRPMAWLVAAALAVGGSILFAAAVALPILAESTFLKGFAPIGGSTVMIGWLVAAAAALRQATGRDA